MTEVEKIAKAITSITKSYPTYDVFCDMTECLAIAYENMGGFVEGPNYEQNEKNYQIIRKKYKADEFERMINIYPMFVDYANRHSISDIFGKVFETAQLSNKATSQFFTPEQVSDLNSELITNNLIQEIDKNGYAIASDPTCGAGVNLLATANRLLRKGYNPQQQLIIDASDIDARCCNMAFVQFSIYGLPAVVRQMDLLTDECQKVMKTPMLVLNGWDYRLHSGGKTL